MKRLALLGAAALTVAALIPTDASAQRGRGITARGVGGGYAIRRAAIGPRVGLVGRPGVRWLGPWPPGWGLPRPVVVYNGAGNGYANDYGYASYAPQGYGSCVGWDGYQWVNACYYESPPIAGGGQYLAPY